MASHAQISRNISDVSSAWGQFQRLVHSDLPRIGGVVTSARHLAATRRRYA